MYSMLHALCVCVELVVLVRVTTSLASHPYFSLWCACAGKAHLVACASGNMCQVFVPKRNVICYVASQSHMIHVFTPCKIHQ